MLFVMTMYHKLCNVRGSPQRESLNKSNNSEFYKWLPIMMCVVFAEKYLCL